MSSLIVESKQLLSPFIYFYCFRGSDIPKPPEGHRWKEVRHDNGVTWLCSWTENVLGSNKYIMLNPSSKIKVRPLRMIA